MLVLGPPVLRVLGLLVLLAVATESQLPLTPLAVAKTHSCKGVQLWLQPAPLTSVPGGSLMQLLMITLYVPHNSNCSRQPI